MDKSELVSRVLQGVMLQVPVMFVCIAGTILLGLRCRRLGRGAVPALLGSSLALIASTGYPIIWAILKTMQERLSSITMRQLIAVQFGHSFLWAAALLLLFIGFALACPQRKA